MQAYLQKNGVVINRFILKNKALKKYYHGLHEKILMVDQQQMMVGGRNIKDNYFGLSPNFNFFDYDVLVTGDSLLQDARIHFYTLWHDERLSSPYPTAAITEQESLKNIEKIQFATAFVQQKLQIQLESNTNWRPDSCATTAPIGFINDDFYIKKGRHYVGSDEKDLGSTNAHIRFIDSAKYSICIENPYFVPTKAWKNALHNALLRGVKVRLLTNSIRSTDLPIRQAAYRNQRKKWLRWGLEIWEYHGTEKWHAKALLIDNETVVIGSYNIHRPSEKYNTEVAVWIKDRKTAQIQEIVMTHNIDNSLQIGADNRKMHQPIRNFKRASFGLRSKVFLYQYTVAWVFGWLM
jgi:cardiolipin synthase C